MNFGANAINKYTKKGPAAHGEFGKLWTYVQVKNWAQTSLEVLTLPILTQLKNCSEELFLSSKGAFPLKEINSGFMLRVRKFCTNL